MRIGIDFDNTLVCYDELFHRVAVESGSIPSTLPASKTAVRDYLREQGKEPLWTEMQGVVYGSRILEASPYPGAVDFIREMILKGCEILVISHKTRYPFLGEQVDLHEAAKRWLSQYEIQDLVGDTRENPKFFFELTKESKLDRISRQKCDCFIDDLPEILTHHLFPPGVRKICFDPGNQITKLSDFEVVHHWLEVKHAMA